MTTQRQHLDAEMRAVLNELRLCSHVPAAGWGPSGRSRSSDEPMGGSRPPGDYGATIYEQRYGRPFHLPTWKYPGAANDDERREVIDEARGELKHLRGHARKEQPAGETRQQRDARIVREGEGFSDKEVALRFRCGVGDVRAARKAAERDPYFGKADAPGVAAAERRERVREMQGRGLTKAQIAAILHVSRDTVERDLKRMAA